jgi:HD superfamily phosphohydrolase YqeK
MYDKIANDPYIKNLYHDIEIYEDLTGGEGYHNYDHVMNVANTIEIVLTKLGYSIDIIESAKIAAVLHDIGSIEGKEGHPYRGSIMSKEYFVNNNIKLENEAEILDAILNHSNGFDSESIITSSLVFADKIDIKYNRLAKAGYNNIGARQMQYVKDVTFDIVDNKIIVDFVTDSNIDIEEYCNWYFLPKVFKAIAGFSNKINMEYIITMNGKTWQFAIDTLKH